MVQEYCKNIGATGCYFLSIVKAAEDYTGKEIDVVHSYIKVTQLGYMDMDCYVKDPAAIMNYLTGEKWSTTKAEISYKPKPKDIIIGRFERKASMTTYTHFVLLDSNKNVIYDSFGKSRTVQDGKLMSLRVFWKA